MAQDMADLVNVPWTLGKKKKCTVVLLGGASMCRSDLWLAVWSRPVCAEFLSRTPSGR